jgi:hypothetical protein
VATNITENENYSIFELVKKKNWANVQRIIELFTQKNVIRLSRIGIGLGSGIRKKPIPGPVSKRHRIPDPGSATLKKLYAKQN